MTYCDNKNVSGDTPLSYNLSMPSWLVNKQLGINGLCKQSWRHRKCPSQTIRERFANPFEKSSENNLKPLPYKLSNHGKQNFIILRHHTTGTKLIPFSFSRRS